MRISDWSSDVCSSDLEARQQIHRPGDESRHTLRIGERDALGHQLPGDEREVGDDDHHDGDGDAVAAGGQRGEAIEPVAEAIRQRRSEEHTSELQSLMRISYDAFFWTNTKKKDNIQVLHTLKN